jgi:hypothetical protein
MPAVVVSPVRGWQWIELVHECFSTTAISSSPSPRSLLQARIDHAAGPRRPVAVTLGRRDAGEHAPTSGATLPRRLLEGRSACLRGARQLASFGCAGAVLSSTLAALPAMLAAVPASTRAAPLLHPRDALPSPLRTTTTLAARWLRSIAQTTTININTKTGVTQTGAGPGPNDCSLGRLEVGSGRRATRAGRRARRRPACGGGRISRCLPG